MVTIESTPEFAAQTYEQMSERLQVVRRRLNRPLSLAEKVLLSHLDDPENQEIVPGETYIRVRPDRVILQDVLGQTAMLQFMQTLRNNVVVPTTIHCDHLVQAREEGAQDLRESLAENGEVYGFLRSAAARYGVGFWEPGAGIIHQVNLENYAFPGQVIIGTDSHTPNAGGLGACSVGVGGADAVSGAAQRKAARARTRARTRGRRANASRVRAHNFRGRRSRGSSLRRSDGSRRSAHEAWDDRRQPRTLGGRTGRELRSPAGATARSSTSHYSRYVRLDDDQRCLLSHPAEVDALDFLGRADNTSIRRAR